MDASQMTSDVINDVKNALAKVAILAISPILPILPCKNLHEKSENSKKSHNSQCTFSKNRNGRKKNYALSCGAGDELLAGMACRATDDVTRIRFGAKDKELFDTNESA